MEENVQSIALSLVTKNEFVTGELLDNVLKLFREEIVREITSQIQKFKDESPMNTKPITQLVQNPSENKEDKLPNTEIMRSNNYNRTPVEQTQLMGSPNTTYNTTTIQQQPTQLKNNPIPQQTQFDNSMVTSRIYPIVDQNTPQIPFQQTSPQIQQPQMQAINPNFPQFPQQNPITRSGPMSFGQPVIDINTPQQYPQTSQYPTYQQYNQPINYSQPFQQYQQTYPFNYTSQREHPLGLRTKVYQPTFPQMNPTSRPSVQQVPSVVKEYSPQPQVYTKLSSNIGDADIELIKSCEGYFKNWIQLTTYKINFDTNKGVEDEVTMTQMFYDTVYFKSKTMIVVFADDCAFGYYSESGSTSMFYNSDFFFGLRGKLRNSNNKPTRFFGDQFGKMVRFNVFKDKESASGKDLFGLAKERENVLIVRDPSTQSYHKNLEQTFKDKGKRTSLVTFLPERNDFVARRIIVLSF
ncbi:hypothetical protein EIN_251980 [Entamoeba invadens IP1]|uniref:Uncharacterized protein n=1 Tax=Entamoeba invadens IP1 TaxID=370355 RepID=A0A0A1UGM4_ENTIV|nr:hypothetical protein EIN_251980 [Entamoeba invadens IP1]ELP95004.1 hypothetical protein EIN_251980 [Entamoeba invadens IP1]|eukprot:XP_004261775.1 hypothetical protein EIN_251980 [Entamoeba invadens IP1]